MRSHCIALWSWCAAMTFALPLYASDKNHSTIPDEIVTPGGQAAYQAGSGAALVSDQGAIHINPAMLYRHRTYDVGGTYTWPVVGREYYRVSAIDGVTSKWTTAFEYTGFGDGLAGRETRNLDSPVRRRGALGFSIPSDFVAVGFAGNYLEADDPRSAQTQTIKAFTLGAGLVAQLSHNFSFGASVENFNNKKVKDVAPQTVRAGVAYEDKGGTLGVYADYRDRERSPYLEERLLTADLNHMVPLDTNVTPSNLPRERMALIGGQVQTFDVLRIFFGAGKNVGGEHAEVISGGLGIFQKNFSLAYGVSRTYPNVKDLQDSVTLSITMKM
ncbi:MAG: hypothetical protein H7249_18860 [Chitinophagaceae bacterium]|nr:hypothetical protein [Oligoflexus sp.]